MQMRHFSNLLKIRCWRSHPWFSWHFLERAPHAGRIRARALGSRTVTAFGARGVLHGKRKPIHNPSVHRYKRHRPWREANITGNANQINVHEPTVQAESTLTQSTNCCSLNVNNFPWSVALAHHGVLVELNMGGRRSAPQRWRTCSGRRPWRPPQWRAVEKFRLAARLLPPKLPPRDDCENSLAIEPHRRPASRYANPQSLPVQVEIVGAGSPSPARGDIARSSPQSPPKCCGCCCCCGCCGCWCCWCCWCCCCCFMV